MRRDTGPGDILHWRHRTERRGEGKPVSLPGRTGIDWERNSGCGPDEGKHCDSRAHDPSAEKASGSGAHQVFFAEFPYRYR